LKINIDIEFEKYDGVDSKAIEILTERIFRKEELKEFTEVEDSDELIESTIFDLWDTELGVIKKGDFVIRIGDHIMILREEPFFEAFGSLEATYREQNGVENE
jgi:hypothetical protein